MIEPRAIVFRANRSPRSHAPPCAMHGFAEKTAAAQAFERRKRPAWRAASHATPSSHDAPPASRPRKLGQNRHIARGRSTALSYEPRAETPATPKLGGCHVYFAEGFHLYIAATQSLTAFYTSSGGVALYV